MRRALAVLCLALLPCGAFAQDYQYEDNVRDLLASARALMSAGNLEEGAIEYENVLAIDPRHREAALALFDAYLQLGAVAGAEQLLPRLGGLGVDSSEHDKLKLKIEVTRRNPPKRAPYTASLSAPPVAAPGAPPPAGDIDIELDGPAPAPAPAASAAPGAAPASPAPANPELDIDL